MRDARGKHDIQAIIDLITHDERFAQSSHFSKDYYREEPILTTGRRMQNYLPDEYRKMKSVAKLQQGGNGTPKRVLPRAEQFYYQAKMMEGFEDDCPYRGQFSVFKPTYSDMSDKQLRGYFTWRALVRAGKAPEHTPDAYPEVLASELICGIGYEDAAEGLAQLSHLVESYRATNKTIGSMGTEWIRDFAAYHDLSAKSYLSQACREDELALERVLDVLGRGSAANPRTFIDDLARVGHMELSRNEVYRADADALGRVALATCRKLVTYYDRHRKLSFCDYLLGHPVSHSHTMFMDAVFFEPTRHADQTVRIGPNLTYRCEKGAWRVEGFYRYGSSYARIQGLVEACAAELAPRLGVEPNPAQEDADQPAKYVRALIRRAVKDLDKREREDEAAPAEPRVFTIDLAQLKDIRKAAEGTCEALLVEEERTGEETVEEPPLPRPHASRADSAPSPASTRIAPAATSAPAPGPTGANGTPRLSEDEHALLSALLAGTALAPRLQRRADLLVDAVNEKLFDLLGDTAVEMGPQGPELVEDYRPDLEGLI